MPSLALSGRKENGRAPRRERGLVAMRELLIFPADVDVVADDSAENRTGGGADQSALHLVAAGPRADPGAGRGSDCGVRSRVLPRLRRGCGSRRIPPPAARAQAPQAVK